MQSPSARASGSQTAAADEPRPSLIVGALMRCPHCELLRDPLNPREFMRLERNEKYADELNVIYRCMKSGGGCGHVFSPGDPWILQAYLAGDLVPAQHTKNEGGKH